MIIVNYIASILLLGLGLYAVCTQKNLIKMVVGLSIMDYGINLFIVSIGFSEGGTAPILTLSDLLNGIASTHYVDPVPQALTLTSIVIGACVDAMALALIIKLFQKYQSISTDEIRRMRG